MFYGFSAPSGSNDISIFAYYVYSATEKYQTYFSEENNEK